MPRYIRGRRSGYAMGAAGLAALMLAGCMVGPNYKEPSPRLQQEWMDPGHPGVQRGAAELTKWWEVLNDPVLNDPGATGLSRTTRPCRRRRCACCRPRRPAESPSGLLFPQQQEARGDFSWNQDEREQRLAERGRLVRATQSNGSFHNWEVPGLVRRLGTGYLGPLPPRDRSRGRHGPGFAGQLR